MNEFDHRILALLSHQRERPEWGIEPCNKYYDTNLPEQNEYRTNKLDLAYTASSEKPKSGHIGGRLEHSALRQSCSRCVITLAIKMV